MEVASPLSSSSFPSTLPSPLPSPSPSPSPAWVFMQRQETMAKARDRIIALKEALKSLHLPSLDAMLESPDPLKSLLQDESVAREIVARLTEPSSGHSQDPVCQWLYDTFQTFDSGLQTVVLRYMPVLCGVYLPRVTRQGEQSMAGFEAVLLAIYASQASSEPTFITIPDLSQSSLYHIPMVASSTTSSSAPRLAQISPPGVAEAEDTIRSTARARFIGVALDLFFCRIAEMPDESKIEACRYALLLAGIPSSSSSSSRSLQIEEEEEIDPPAPFLSFPSPFRHLSGPDDGAPLPFFSSAFSSNKMMMMISPLRSGSARFDHSQRKMADVDPGSSLKRFTSLRFTFGEEGTRWKGMPVDVDTRPAGRGAKDGHGGSKVPLNWEIFRPLLKILGHCLLAPLSSEDLKTVASAAIRALHSRASHDLLPAAIFATRSLMRLDLAARDAAKQEQQRAPLSPIADQLADS